MSNDNEIYRYISHLPEKKRLEKAERHFRDALYLRPVRHDLDEAPKAITAIYSFQTNPHTRFILLLASITMVGLVLLEPAHWGDQNYSATKGQAHIYEWLLRLEIIAVFLFWMDWVLQIIHLRYDEKRTFAEKYVLNWTLPLSFLLCIFYTMDLIVFHNSLPRLTLRYSRPFRPFSVIIHCKALRRMVETAWISYHEVLSLIIFNVVYVMLLTVIGIGILGPTEPTETSNGIQNEYTTFYKMMHELFMLVSGEGWPHMAFPAMKNSHWYLLYFIPFLVLGRFLLVPIPIGYLIKTYKAKTAEKLIADSIIEKEGLFLTFLCLDTNNNKAIDEKQFKLFFIKCFDNCLYVDRLNELYKLLSKDSHGRIHLTEWHNILNLLRIKQFSCLKKSKFFGWETLKAWLEENCKISKIVVSKQYNAVLLATILLNWINVLVFIGNEYPAACETINKALCYIYAVDFAMKGVAHGIRTYFEDSRNVMDFTLTVISFVVPVPFQSVNLLRIIHLNRLLRCIVGFDSTKIRVKVWKQQELTLATAVLKIFFEVESIFRKVVTILPSALRFVTMIFLVMYTYAIIGMENFNNVFATTPKSRFLNINHFNFDSFEFSMLSLFDIVLLKTWAPILADVQDRFATGYSLVALYFDSYYTIISVIFFSMIQGLIVDTFLIVTKSEEDYLEILKAEANQPAKNVSNGTKSTSDRKASRFSAIFDSEFEMKMITPATAERYGKRNSENVTRRILEAIPRDNGIPGRLKEKSEIAIPMGNLNSEVALNALRVNLLSSQGQKGAQDLVTDQPEKSYEPPSFHTPESERKKESEQKRDNVLSTPSIESKLITERKSDNTLLVKLKPIDINTTSLKEGTGYNPYGNELNPPLPFKPAKLDLDHNVKKRDRMLLRNFHFDLAQRKVYQKEIESNTKEKPYFEQCYGNLYNKLKGETRQEILNRLHDTENQILLKLIQLLRVSLVSAGEVPQRLGEIEESVSSKLLRKGSVCKFVFQTVNGDWLTLAKRGQSNNYSLRNIDFDSWEKIAQNTPQTNEIYYRKDIFNERERHREVIEDFKEILGVLTDSQGKSLDLSELEENSWDMFVIRFDHSSVKANQSGPSIADCMFVSMNCVKKKSEEFEDEDVEILNCLPLREYLQFLDELAMIVGSSRGSCNFFLEMSSYLSQNWK